MTAAELKRRLVRSRRTMWGYRFAPGRASSDDLAVALTEIGLLRGWANDFPDRADAILALVDRWEKIAAKMRGG